MPGSRRASMVLPEPGGPTNSRLWPPAAAISSARRGDLLPAHVGEIRRRTSRRGASIGPRAAARRRRPARRAGGRRARRGADAALRPRSRRRRRPPRAALCARHDQAAHPAARAPRRRSAARRAPGAARRRAPARRRTACPSSAAGSTTPAAHSMPTAIGTSKAAPSLRRSAGARLTVIRRGGSLKPLFSSAPRMRTRPSRTPASASPTMWQPGSPTADVDLDVDGRGLDPDDGGGGDAREHAAPTMRAAVPARRPRDSRAQPTRRPAAGRRVLRSASASASAAGRERAGAGPDDLERQAQAQAAVERALVGERLAVVRVLGDGRAARCPWRTSGPASCRSRSGRPSSNV